MSTITEVVRETGGRWAKGSSGNPRGTRRRPKLIAELLADALDRAEAGDDKTNAEIIVDRLIELAKTGEAAVSLSATKLIWDRVEGRAPYRVAIEHEHGIDAELRDILAALGVPGASTEDPPSCRPAPNAADLTGSLASADQADVDGRELVAGAVRLAELDTSLAQSLTA